MKRLTVNIINAIELMLRTFQSDAEQRNECRNTGMADCEVASLD